MERLPNLADDILVARRQNLHSGPILFNTRTTITHAMLPSWYVISYAPTAYAHLLLRSVFPRTTTVPPPNPWVARTNKIIHIHIGVV